jgi:serine/threonine protein kinase/tetratricopeptide (TPR) repeat protein
MQSGDLVAGRFEIGSIVSEGGMGLISRARDRLAGGEVALKVSKHADPESRTRFGREARVLRALSHPGIVRYVSDGVSDSGEPWLAMEWLEGEDLGARLGRGPLSGVEAVSVTRGIAEALAHAHGHGLVHRDLKPSNVWLLDGVASNASVKLLDFGVVRQTEPQASLLVTRRGQMLGTPGYMSPEQARGESSVDGRTDLYALGCVLFECLTGRAAFQGEHVVALLAKALLEEPPRLSSMLSVSTELDALVTRLLAKDRDARPRDAHEVLRVLGALGPVEVRAASSPARPSLAREQRWACVLLVGPMTASAEDVTLQHLAPNGLGIAQIASESGARLEHLVGGAQVLLWEGSESPAELARRAARAALSLGGAIGAPVALASGRATMDGAMPVGQALERAAECAKESSGGVVLDESIVELLSARFDVSRASGRPKLIGERELDAGVRAVLGRATPCVGREVELAMLHATLAEVIDEGAAAAVLLTGKMGRGKSRVRYEWVRSLAASGPEVCVWQAHADVMHERAVYGVASRLVRDASGVPFGASREQVRHDVCAAVSAVVAEQDQRRIASRLCELCGAPWEEDLDEALLAAREDAIVMGDQLRGAWEDFLVASCRERAVVLVVENLQWADRASLMLIDRALRNYGDRGWMVLGVGRPEHREAHPKLWSERNVRELVLGPLNDKPAERLVRAVLGAGVAEERMKKLVTKAAGNPYFLEELLRADAEGQGDATPDTVLAMVEARILRLEPEMRRVLRAASVYGGRFDVRGLEAVLEEASSPPLLEALVARDGLVPLERGGYAFPQASFREAAYAMLVEEDKRLAHGRAAEHLAASGGDPVAIAEHHERAQSPARAAPWWAKAAKQALEANEFRDSVARAEASERCGAEGETLAEALLLRAEALSWLDNAALCAAIDRLGAVATTIEHQAHALRWGALGALRAGDTARLEEIVDRADALCRRERDHDDVLFCALRIASIVHQAGLGERAVALASLLEAADPPLESRGPRVLGARARWRVVCADQAHDLERSLHLRAEAARILRSGGDLRAAVVEEGTRGFTLTLLGAYEEAVSVLTISLGESRRLGLSGAVAATQQNLGLALLGLGRLDAALELERETLGEFSSRRQPRGGGNPLMEAASRDYVTRILVAAGRPEEAVAEAERAIALLPVAHPFALAAGASLAEALLARGGPGDAGLALSHARRAWQALRASPSAYEDPAHILRVHLDALAANALAEEADRARDEARAWVLERASTIPSEHYRRTFLEGALDVARILDACGPR